MNQEKFFYSIVKYNGRLPSKFEFYPLLDHVQYGNEDHAKKVLDFVNKTVFFLGGDPLYKLYRLEFQEL